MFSSSFLSLKYSGKSKYTLFEELMDYCLSSKSDLFLNFLYILPKRLYFCKSNDEMEPKRLVQNPEVQNRMRISDLQLNVFFLPS